MSIDIVKDLECLWAGGAICGEGLCWQEEEQAIYWVDIDGRKAHRYRLNDGVIDSWDLPEKTGWLLPCAGQSEWLAGCKSGVYLINLDSGSREFLVDPEPDLPGNRLNDAKVDMDGRLWAGTMSDEEKIATGWLYRIDCDLTCTRWDGPYITTNGPAMSSDNRILYHVDTYGGIVYAFDKHRDGTIDGRRIFARIDEGDGKPDGLTVDADGFVWLAHWGGSRITRFAPNGTVDGVLEIPAPQVTNCAFGGPDMNLLFITTAARNIDLKVHPKAGGLFCIQTSVRGLLSPEFILG